MLTWLLISPVAVLMGRLGRHLNWSNWFSWHSRTQVRLARPDVLDGC